MHRDIRRLANTVRRLQALMASRGVEAARFRLNDAGDEINRHERGVRISVNDNAKKAAMRLVEGGGE